MQTQAAFLRQSKPFEKTSEFSGSFYTETATWLGLEACPVESGSNRPFSTGDTTKRKNTVVGATAKGTSCEVSAVTSPNFPTWHVDGVSTTCCTSVKTSDRYVVVHQATGLSKQNIHSVSVSVVTDAGPEAATSLQPSGRSPLWNELLVLPLPVGQVDLKIVVRGIPEEESPQVDLWNGEFALTVLATNTFDTQWVSLNQGVAIGDKHSDESSPYGRVKISVATCLEDAQAIQRGLLPERSFVAIGSVTGSTISGACLHRMAPL